MTAWILKDFFRDGGPQGIALALFVFIIRGVVWALIWGNRKKIDKKIHELFLSREAAESAESVLMVFGLLWDYQVFFVCFPRFMGIYPPPTNFDLVMSGTFTFVQWAGMNAPAAKQLLGGGMLATVPYVSLAAVCMLAFSFREISEAGRLPYMSLLVIALFQIELPANVVFRFLWVRRQKGKIWIKGCCPAGEGGFPCFCSSPI